VTAKVNTITVFRLGAVEYEAARQLQERIAAARAADETGDALLLLQHPPVITVGRGGGEEDILVPASRLRREGVRVLSTDRGGRATYHGPGQSVIYPILKLQPTDDDLYTYVWKLEEAIIRALSSYGLTAGRMAAHPGVWVDGRKIAAVGLAVRDGVTRHGLALNVAPDMAHFDLLIPCGIADRGVTSMARELGWTPDQAKVEDRFVGAFAQVFDRQVTVGDPEALPLQTSTSTRRGRACPCPGPASSPEQPAWLWQTVTPETEAAAERMAHVLADLALHTVCQEARCPNIGACFGRGAATFLILGDACTRRCRFCAVTHGPPSPVDPDEPARVAEAAARLGLRHVVVTSVTRDDLPDGGAGHFAATVHAVRRRLPGAVIEVLIPDFGGSATALAAVSNARPDVLNHNLETAPRLYPRVRPGADYRRSLALLAWVKTHAPSVVTKSGLMLGLGERVAEVLDVLRDLRQVGCDLITLGQYLQPTGRQLPVVRYTPPEEFAAYRQKVEEMGFRGVASGPLVRSSHRADELWAAAARSDRQHLGHRGVMLCVRRGDARRHVALAGGESR